MAFRPKLGVVKKNAPSVSDPAMKRVVDTIYKDINSLSDSLHLPSGTHTFLPRDGNPGDIRLYEGTGNDGSTGYFLQGRVKDGWASVKLTLETRNPENVDTAAVPGADLNPAHITRHDVTRVNLALNGDVGMALGQVAPGEHGHDHEDLDDIASGAVVAQHRLVGTVSQMVDLNTSNDGAGDTTWAGSSHGHKLNEAITPTWTGNHKFGSSVGAAPLTTFYGAGQGAGAANAVEIYGHVLIDGSLTVPFSTSTANDVTLTGNVALNIGTSGNENTKTTTIYGPTTIENRTTIIPFELDATQPALNVQGATNAAHGQFRVSYDANNYFDLRVDTSGNLLLDTIGNIQLLPQAGDDTPGQVLPKQTLLTDLGDFNRMFRSLFVGEIYAETLVAQDVLATIGGRLSVAPTTMLETAINMEATTISVRHNIFDTGDFAIMKSAPMGLPQTEILKITNEGDWAYTRNTHTNLLNLEYGTTFDAYQDAVEADWGIRPNARITIDEVDPDISDILEDGQWILVSGTGGNAYADTPGIDGAYKALIKVEDPDGGTTGYSLAPDLELGQIDLRVPTDVFATLENKAFADMVVHVGPYTYNVTRSVADIGLANHWQEGDAIMNLGHEQGDGFIELTSTETAYQDLGPSITMYSRDDTSPATWNGALPVASIGRLKSFVDYNDLDIHGVAFGKNLYQSTGSATPFQGITIDPSNGVRLFNSDLKFYDASELMAHYETSGNFRIGENLQNDDPPLYDITHENTNATLGMSWDGSLLRISGAVDITGGEAFGQISSLQSSIGTITGTTIPNLQSTLEDADDAQSNWLGNSLGSQIPPGIEWDGTLLITAAADQYVSRGYVKVSQPDNGKIFIQTMTYNSNANSWADIAISDNDPTNDQKFVISKPSKLYNMASFDIMIPAFGGVDFTGHGIQGSDQTNMTFYLMWSDVARTTRFTGGDSLGTYSVNGDTNTTNHIIMVFFNPLSGIAGKWYAVGRLFGTGSSGNNTYTEFTPVDTDLLICAFNQSKINNGDCDFVTFLQPSETSQSSDLEYAQGIIDSSLTGLEGVVDDIVPGIAPDTEGGGVVVDGGMEWTGMQSVDDSQITDSELWYWYEYHKVDGTDLGATPIDKVTGAGYIYNGTQALRLIPLNAYDTCVKQTRENGTELNYIPCVPGMKVNLEAQVKPVTSGSNAAIGLTFYESDKTQIGNTTDITRDGWNTTTANQWNHLTESYTIAGTISAKIPRYFVITLIGKTNSTSPIYFDDVRCTMMVGMAYPAVPNATGGLFLGNNYMGFHDGSEWKSYFTNTGDMFLNNSNDSHYLSWDSETLTIQGNLVIGGTNLTPGNTLNENTTADNVGLGNVDNMSSDDIQSGTTATDVGLGNVTNLSADDIQAGTDWGDVTPFGNTQITLDGSTGTVSVGTADGSAIRSGTKTYGSNDAGFWFGRSGSDYQFDIGASGSGMLFDGDILTLKNCGISVEQSSGTDVYIDENIPSKGGRDNIMIGGWLDQNGGSEAGDGILVQLSHIRDPNANAGVAASGRYDYIKMDSGGFSRAGHDYPIYIGNLMDICGVLTYSQISGFDSQDDTGYFPDNTDWWQYDVEDPNGNYYLLVTDNGNGYEAGQTYNNDHYYYGPPGYSTMGHGMNVGKALRYLMNYRYIPDGRTLCWTFMPTGITDLDKQSLGTVNFDFGYRKQYYGPMSGGTGHTHYGYYYAFMHNASTWNAGINSVTQAYPNHSAILDELDENADDAGTPWTDQISYGAIKGPKDFATDNLWFCSSERHQTNNSVEIYGVCGNLQFWEIETQSPVLAGGGEVP